MYDVKLFFLRRMLTRHIFIYIQLLFLDAKTNRKISIQKYISSYLIINKCVNLH